MKNEHYKSPWSALLWSFALPGFGQLYNRDLILGFALIILELFMNFSSHLNLSLMHTLHGELKQSHDIVDFQSGLFYPSVWAFSMWEAYNRCKKRNWDLEEMGLKPKDKHTAFTGLFFGLVFGMNIGLHWHHLFLSPVISGVIIGITGAIAGHLIEKLIEKKTTHNRSS